MADPLRSFVRRLLEIQGSSDLISVETRMRVRTSNKMTPDAPTVPDIMTNIRIALGVAIVRQTVPIKRIRGGRDILELEIKYMPEEADLGASIRALGKAIKDVPGVEIVKITKVGGRVVKTSEGGQFLF